VIRFLNRKTVFEANKKMTLSKNLFVLRPVAALDFVSVKTSIVVISGDLLNNTFLQQLPFYSLKLFQQN
jgi:hypothetical protein